MSYDAESEYCPHGQFVWLDCEQCAAVERAVEKAACQHEDVIDTFSSGINRKIERRTCVKCGSVRDTAISGTRPRPEEDHGG